VGVGRGVTGTSRGRGVARGVEVGVTALRGIGVKVPVVIATAVA
jgi:hypothetical protein